MRWMAIKLGAQPWLPRYSRLIVGTDKFLQRLSRGRVTIMMATGLHELVLQVPGRKTGILRSTPLLTVPHGDGWLIVGSNWGAQRPARLGGATCASPTSRRSPSRAAPSPSTPASSPGPSATRSGRSPSPAGPTTASTPSAPTASCRSSGSRRAGVSAAPAPAAARGCTPCRSSLPGPMESPSSWRGVSDGGADRRWCGRSSG